MNKSNKRKLIFAITLLLAGLVYAWAYPMNKGLVSLNANESDYLAIVETTQINCTSNPCEFKLTSRGHTLNLKKEGYYDQTYNFFVKRGEKNSFNIEFKKIPKLNISPIVPTKEPKEIPKEYRDQLAPAWNNEEKTLAFIDRSDDRLKIWDGQEEKTITVLRGISDELNLSWSKDDRTLIGIEKINFYLINIEKASRKKQILSFEPSNIKWSIENDILFLNDSQKKLYSVNIEDNKLSALEKNLDLSASVWENDRSLISFTNGFNENNVKIKRINLLSGESEEIMTKHNFIASQITNDENNNIYLLNELDDTWYLLEY